MFSAASFVFPLLTFNAVGAANVNFTECLLNIRDTTWRASRNILEGGTDNHGRSAALNTSTTAITYGLCREACGTGPEAFVWLAFSKQFSSWLLPWLALVSQLPFGAEDKLDDVVTMLLAVGSPTLAAFSLAITILNGRWAAKHLRSPKRKHRNTENAIHVLNSLQQFPLKVTLDGDLLSSLVENRGWWEYLGARLAGRRTWAISTATSIAWVFIAYILSVIDSLIDDDISIHGHGVGAVWLWLLPIVVGWLQVLTKNDLKADVEIANQAYIEPLGGQGATEHPPPERAISLVCDLDDPLFCEAGRTDPIYNYVRIFSWTHAVETVATAFELTSVVGLAPVQPVADGDLPDQPGRLLPLLPLNGASRNPRPIREEARTQNSHVLSRTFVASILALTLQWGTTGAAILIVWFTPTIGLGCRSGAYILYGAVSTLVWMVFMISSALSHYATTRRPASRSKVRTASIFLRRLGKVMACCNAIGIVLICLLQFSSFFNTCWCNSSVLWLKDTAYNVMFFMPDDIHVTKDAQIGGVFLASGTAMIFVTFTSLLISQPPLIK